MSSAVSIQLASNLLHKNKTTRDYYIYHSVLRKTGQFHKTIYTRLLNFSFNFLSIGKNVLHYLKVSKVQYFKTNHRQTKRYLLNLLATASKTHEIDNRWFSF